jgi:hypothetical protein
MNAEQLDEQIRKTLDRIDQERAEVERKRNNPTPAERAERIERLRAHYPGYVPNDLKVFAFKRRIRSRLAWHSAGLILTHWPKDKPLSWAALYSSMDERAVGARVSGYWFRAHEGGYPCVHEGVLIGLCSPEYATAFEQLVAHGRISVEIDFARVGRHHDDYGLPSATVRLRRGDEPTAPDMRPAA